ncbi:MAG: hypothetical protein GY720_03395 [bacterium]|nr:hypothetical protein [bacterium]
MTRRIRTLVLGIALLASMLAGAPAASALSCGDTVTTNTTLAGNLSCSGTALVIGADGIIIDLGGFSISGDGTGSGIFDGAGHSGFTVRNGRIRNFEFGVYLVGPATGVAFRTIEDLRIRDNTDAGIRLENAREVIVQRVRVWRNGTAANSTGEGLDIIGSLSLQVRDSVFFNNLQNGVRVNQGEEVILIGNVMRDNAVAGIDYANATDSFAKDNRIVRNQAGVFFSDSSGHTLVTNSIRHNTVGVIVTNPPAGISRLNRFEGNGISRNGEGMLFEDPATNDTIVVGNTIRRNGADGIRVLDGKVVFEDNRAAANGGSGLALLGGVQDVNGNVAVSNVGWGIFVGAATVTGASNVATGNGAGDCNQPGLC